MDVRGYSVSEVRDRALSAVSENPEADSRLREAAHLLADAVVNQGAINADEWSAAASMIDEVCTDLAGEHPTDRPEPG